MTFHALGMVVLGVSMLLASGPAAAQTAQAVRAGGVAQCAYGGCWRTGSAAGSDALELRMTRAGVAAECAYGGSACAASAAIDDDIDAQRVREGIAAQCAYESCPPAATRAPAPGVLEAQPGSPAAR